MALSEIRTPLVRLPWQGRNDILVKDESCCPTGTFKDRLAWALAGLLLKRGTRQGELYSCITLGNTLLSLAEAFTTAFPKDRKPQLLGLFPLGFSERQIGPDNFKRVMPGGRLLRKLQSMGVVCQEVDLSNGYLSETDVCRLATGLGLTFDTHHDVSRGIEIPAYEAVLRESIAQGAVALDWIVVPVGAGVLFEDFVNYAEREGLPARVLGVAALRADSVADKLYALYSPYFDALNRFGQAAHDRYPRHRVIAVDDEAIRRVIPLLPPPMRAEPSAAAAFTVLESERLISAKSNVLLVNTGDGIISEG